MVFLGTDTESGDDVELTPQARRQGVYVIGTTGTGKTTLLKSIAYQDMLAGDGLCLLDPHGDMIDELLEIVPPEREDDVIVFAPGDDDQIEHPLGLNLFDCDRRDPKQTRRVTSTVIDTLRKLFWYSWGPRMEDLLRSSILTLMEKPDTTFLDLWLLLASKNHRQQYTRDLKDPYIQQFWDVQFARYPPRDVVEVTGSSLNKIGRFLADRHMRNIVAQPQSAFNMREIMDNRKILLVNLSKGELGEDNSALLGAVLVNLILIAALTRRNVPPGDRVLFHLIVDEYQSFATESFPTLQSEARKYAIDVIVAHQYRDQLDELNRGSTLNVANFIVLRVSGVDSQELATQFDNTPPPPELVWEVVRTEHGQYPGLFKRENVDRQILGPRRLYTDVAAERANQLAGLANFQALCRLIEGTELTEHTVALKAEFPEVGDQKRANRIRQASLARGVPKTEIEDFVAERVGEDVEFDYLVPVDEDSDD